MTTRYNRSTCKLAPFAAGMLLLVGCGKPPESDAEDVLQYLRNAGVGAKVRELDGVAQPYVTSVLMAKAEWTEANRPIAELATLGALWPMEDPRWRDQGAVKAKLDAVLAWQSPKPREKRQALLTKLMDETGDIPDLAIPHPPLTKEAVIEALTGDEPELQSRMQWYEQVALLYQHLFQLVLDHADGFDAEHEGLTFKSPATTAAAQDEWSKLDDLLLERRDAMIARYEHRLATYPDQRDQAKQQEASLRQAQRERTLDPSDQRRLRRLKLVVEYYKSAIQTTEDELQAIRKAMEKAEQEEREEGSASHPA